MDYSYIESLREQLKGKNIPLSVMLNFNRAFDVEYAHHSTAIEGNTLTLIETKTVLEDGISIGGKKLREIYEVVDHDKAFAFVRIKTAEGVVLTEKLVKDIHRIVMKNITLGGIYRICDVVITGAAYTHPTINEMLSQIKYLYSKLNRDDLNPIELAAWVHSEFVRIHPFADGNGRTARLIMNYSLMSSGFLPVNIKAEERLRYYETLDAYAANGDISPFAELVAELEIAELKKYLSIRS